MYNLRARVRGPASGSVRTPGEMRDLVLPRTVASQITPSQALEMLSEITTVPESEAPLVEADMIDEASEIVQSNLTMRDIMVIPSDTENALVPATAVTTEVNNIAHSGPIRFDGDTRAISEENAKISSHHKNANLTDVVGEWYSIMYEIFFVNFWVTILCPVFVH